MSIINEALKKTQVNLKRKTGKDISKIYTKLNKLNELHRKARHSHPKKTELSVDNPEQESPNIIPEQKKHTPDGSTSHPDLNPEQDTAPAETAKNIGSQKKIFILLSYSLFITAGVASAFLFNRPNEAPNKVASPNVKTGIIHAKPAQPVTVIQKILEPHAKNKIILNGTMTMGNKRVALLNDEIYEVGESIFGKKIINITLEKVELQDKDKIIALEVKHKHTRSR